MPRGGRGSDIWRLVRQHDTAWLRDRLFIVALNQQQEVVGAGEVPLAELTAARLRGAFKEMRLAPPVTFIAVHHQANARSQPSKSDWLIAERLEQAADEIGGRLLEYFVFSRGRYRSLSDRGRLL